MIETDFASVLGEAARQARRDAPGLLIEAEATMKQAAFEQEPALRLAAWAGLLRALTHLLEAAYRRAGSEVRETIFSLHGALGVARASRPGGAPSLASLAPAYRRLLAYCAARDPALRALILQALEILDERLTMQRYSAAVHRRRQARALLGEPLRWALDLARQKPSLDGPSEALLAFWDLVHAAPLAERGWNRIEWSGENPLGGFFGLADEARPPDEAARRRAAREVRTMVEREAAALVAAHGLPEKIASWLKASLERIDEALAIYAAGGAWPAWVLASPRGGLWARIQRRIFKAR